MYQVDIKNLLLDKDELDELIAHVRNKPFMDKQYKGDGKGFAGGTYDYELTECHETGNLEIHVVPENIWLYLNTFGKEKE